MAKSSKKVVNHTVIVVRDGRQVVVEPNKAYAFTESEIEDIIRHQGEDSIREPINEDSDAVIVEDKPVKLTAKQQKAADEAAAKAAEAARGPATGGATGEGGSDNTSGDDGEI